MFSLSKKPAPVPSSAASSFFSHQLQQLNSKMQEFLAPLPSPSEIPPSKEKKPKFKKTETLPEIQKTLIHHGFEQADLEALKNKIFIRAKEEVLTIGQALAAFKCESNTVDLERKYQKAAEEEIKTLFLLLSSCRDRMLKVLGSNRLKYDPSNLSRLMSLAKCSPKALSTYKQEFLDSNLKDFWNQFPTPPLPRRTKRKTTQALVKETDEKGMKETREKIKYIF